MIELNTFLFENAKTKKADPQRYEKVRIFHVRVRLQDSMAALPPAKRMVATSF